MEELQARHRKEQRDLQARTTQKKKNATKKTRKSINDECERLRHELNDRHQAEVAQFNSGPQPLTDHFEELHLEDDRAVPNDVTTGKEHTAAILGDGNSSDSSPPSLIPTSSETSPSLPPTPDFPLQGKKPNRQKARLARRATERAAQSAVAAEEAANQTDRRGNEREIMDAAFNRLGLKAVEINPNGHCLYSAVASQLEVLGLGLKPDPANITLPPATLSRIETVASPRHDGYRAVRAVTADFILGHQEDFVPFMEEPLDEYTKRVRLTAEWGGQLELQAIARAYGVTINIVQGDGRIEKITSNHDNEMDQSEKGQRRIWLAYYRHTYGLGEHYNALIEAD
jgi:OTU domain-containing protein 6